MEAFNRKGDVAHRLIVATAAHRSKTNRFVELENTILGHTIFMPQ